MKISDYHFLSLLVPVTLGAQTVVPVDPNCCGNDPEGTVLEIRQSATAEAVNARRVAAAEKGYQAASVEQADEKVSIRSEKKSFLAGSEFLVGAHGFAIVPKGSTVTPGRGLTVASEAPTGTKLQSWKEFQHSNPSVLRLLPVTEAMLAGDEEALETLAAKVKALQTGGIAYVTSLNGNPVCLPSFGSLAAN
ncbi:hypothetical protein [Roseibacillus persicicus]|uniref:hypothetical protein n=1 Tax=Roseibacillus persicicus TaxID=454148 RepID=UPI0028103443|nr:hypothetical protein [Roseibacillus persicicus]MDQ8189434.1 hypothetical protein [Roseibacillus persicicus]